MSTMDDDKFDDFIKGKVSGYQEPGFDPAALAGLHYRMAAAEALWPWYSVYRTELLMGTGLVLCTLVILWNQWSLSTRENSLLMDNLGASKNHGEQIAKLQNEIDHLRSVQPDTIRIIEYREENSSRYNTLLNRIAGLETTIESYWSDQSSDKGVSPAEPGEGVTSDANPESVANPSGSVPIRPAWILRPKERESVRVPWGDKNSMMAANAPSLSVKAMRDIENHYRKGVGIRLGPTVEASKGIYSSGNGRVDLSGGLLSEFILSPSLSLETGGKYARRVYAISDPDDLSSTQFPNVEEGLGSPKNVDIDSWILEIPFNLKYRYPTSLKSHWLVGVGFSPMLFTRQVLEYDYEFSGNSSATVYSIYEKRKPELYAGTLNFSWGLSNEIRKNNFIETSAYYQYGLGRIGVENTKRSFLGVRAVYWFKLR